MPEAIADRWRTWLSSLPLLRRLHVHRCFKQGLSGEVKSSQLHVFTDASEIGYGACAYLRLVDESGNVSCKLVLGKSRVVPRKKQTVPRLELTAAQIGAKLAACVQRELDLPLDATVTNLAGICEHMQL